MELVSVSLRIPKKLDDDLQEYVRHGAYASKTEVLREALRALLYRQVDAMTGALKGKAKSSLSKARKRQWRAALKKAGGNPRKAFGLLEEEEQKSLAGLRF